MGSFGIFAHELRGRAIRRYQPRSNFVQAIDANVTVVERWYRFQFW